MADAFVITGTRPPSAGGPGRVRPLSGRSRSGYHKVGESSNIDETLFKSHNYTTHVQDPGFKYPWVPTPKEEKKKGPPLLWSPSPVDMQRYEKKSQGVISLRHSTTSQSSKSKHRLTKHTPTFVDETLFGERLPEPSFESPWAEKVRSTPLHWAPTNENYNRQMTQGSMRDNNKQEPYSVDGRPPSRQGRRPGSNRSRPLTVESMSSGKSTTVWKP